MIGYLYISITLLLTVYSQLILKWRLDAMGQFPTAYSAQIKFLFVALIDPYIISSFAAAFLASLTWIAALTKFQLSYAYPFMSISFILVMILSYYMFNEPLTLNKVSGIILIVSGLILASK